MENIKRKKRGRPSLNLEETKLLQEIKKYTNKEQTGVETYQNLKIGKTSFYKILKELEEKNVIKRR